MNNIVRNERGLEEMAWTPSFQALIIQKRQIWNYQSVGTDTFIGSKHSATLKTGSKPIDNLCLPWSAVEWNINDHEKNSAVWLSPWLAATLVFSVICTPLRALAPNSCSEVWMDPKTWRKSWLGLRSTGQLSTMESQIAAKRGVG